VYIFRTWGRGFFRCGCPHFLVQKNSDFSKFLVCPHGQEGGGLSQCGYFVNKGRGVNFRDFVRTSVMYGPLSNLWLLQYGVLQQRIELMMTSSV